MVPQIFHGRRCTNRNQRIALAVALANLVFSGLFPPVDQFSVASLSFEVMVVLVNLAISWLLLRDKPAAGAA